VTLVAVLYEVKAKAFSGDHYCQPVRPSDQVQATNPLVGIDFYCNSLSSKHEFHETRRGGSHIIESLNNFLPVLSDIYCPIWVQFGARYRNRCRQGRAVRMCVLKITFMRIP
jgi:hypothetical protein